MLTAHCSPCLSTFLKLFLTQRDQPDSPEGNGGISPFFSLKSLEGFTSFLDPRTRGGTRLSCELGHSDNGAVLAPEGKTPAGRATAYPPADAWGRVDHVDAGRAGEDLPVADHVGHVDVALNAALLELHVVLREGAGLVREDVLHLQTQGLAGWCWPGICSAFWKRER